MKREHEGDLVSVRYLIPRDEHRGLPAGYLVISASRSRSGVLRVVAAYLSLARSKADVARTECLNDGQVNVDFDSDGNVAGVEILSSDGSCHALDLRVAMPGHDTESVRNRALLLVACVTIEKIWKRGDRDAAVAYAQSKPIESADRPLDPSFEDYDLVESWAIPAMMP